MNKHGGQDNNIKINFIEDFSVTTNFMGPSISGLEYLKSNLSEINHYPPQTYEPYKQYLYDFYFKNTNLSENLIQPYLLLGNGASELVDIIIRCIPNGDWKPSKFDVQYLEYERSCTNTKRKKLNYDDPNAILTCIINPNNPTGDYMKLQELKEYISQYCSNDSYVLVDESMQYWIGPDFREQSLMTQLNWIKQIKSERNITIIIIHSMTKFWSCTGIRLGDAIVYDKNLYELILDYQNPWSVNILALKYLEKCITNEEYMIQTWNNTSTYRKNQITKLKSMFIGFDFYGEEFLSWIWIDTGSQIMAKLFYDACKFGGTPIRIGSVGYNKPTFIRMAVRKPEYFEKLLKNVEHLLELNYININHKNHIQTKTNLIKSFEWIDPKILLPHEKFIIERQTRLFDYLINIDNVKTICAIIADADTNIIIDGHHRLSVFEKMGLEKVPVIFVNYSDPDIIVHPFKNTTKNDVINAGLNKNYLEPKSTMHMITDIKSEQYPIICISPLCHIKDSIININHLADFISKQLVVYTDGIYDLFHAGHIRSLNYCKNMFPNVYLIVGIISDKVAQDYKRKPIYSESERYKIISNIKSVDKIIEDAPLIITEEFMKIHNIDLVVHGFSNPEDAAKQSDFYEVPQRLNKFKEIPYNYGVSTTEIIEIIKKY